MNWRERIVVDEHTCFGKPRVKGTRLSVEFILDWLAAGDTHQQILEGYPTIEEEANILACIAYASDVLLSEIEVSRTVG